MAHVWGPRAAVVVAVLMMWTAFASVLSLRLGHSRVPYAAAVDDEYFAPSARLALLAFAGSAIYLLRRPRGQAS